LQLRAVSRAAVDPEGKAGKGTRIKCGVGEINSLACIVSYGNRDGSRSGMNRAGIVAVQRGPSSVLPPVLQRIRVNLLVRLPKNEESLAGKNE
jgi:hypothetical protein